MNKIEQHRKLCEQLNIIYAHKSHDYNGSFGECFKKFGIISAVTRISDKYNRLCSLATKPEGERRVKDESIKDTLLDLSNYALITIIELEREKND